MARDYYEILGLDRGADDGAIKSAYRKMAMKYHPDQNQGDADAETKFKEVNEAYSVLSDPEKRAAYDHYGHAGVSGNMGGGPGGAGFGGDFGDLGDIFSAMFGEAFGDAFGGGRRGGPARGSDVRADMQLTLEEAFNGVEKEIHIPTVVACDSCDGTGAEAGAQPSMCPSCGGAGRVRASQGFFTLERTCPKCQGRGQVIDNPCRQCRGNGVIRKHRTLTVKVPAGIEDGARIRLAGEGDAGARGGPNGDVYVFVSVLRHSFFERQGPHLIVHAPVPLTTAVLGGEIEVPSIEGKILKVKVPEGSQSGTMVRLKKQGMGLVRGRGRGDMLVELNVETPKGLSGKQKKLLQAFADAAEDSHPKTKAFVEQMKRYLSRV
mgnify:CR=1 FL=1